MYLIDNDYKTLKRKIWSHASGDIITLCPRGKYELLDSDPTEYTLYLLSVDSLTDPSEWYKNPTGIFAFVNLTGRLSGNCDSNIAFMIALWNWWECDEGYCEYFHGLGLSKEIDRPTRFKIRHVKATDTDLWGMNWDNIRKNGVAVFKGYTWVDDSKRNDIVSTFKPHHNWFIPHESIQLEAFFLLRKAKSLDSVLVGVHARNPIHFWDPSPEPQSYYDSLLTQVMSIVKSEKGKEVICIIGSDNDNSQQEMIKRLSDRYIRYVHSDNERNKSSGDWYVDGFSRSKYSGAVLDALLFSQCKYFIGGPSNVGYYALSLNPSLLVKVPRVLRNVQCA